MTVTLPMNMRPRTAINNCNYFSAFRLQTVILSYGCQDVYLLNYLPMLVEHFNIYLMHNICIMCYLLIVFQINCRGFVQNFVSL